MDGRYAGAFGFAHTKFINHGPDDYWNYGENQPQRHISGDSALADSRSLSHNFVHPQSDLARTPETNTHHHLHPHQRQQQQSQQKAHHQSPQSSSDLFDAHPNSYPYLRSPSPAIRLYRPESQFRSQSQSQSQSRCRIPSQPPRLPPLTVSVSPILLSPVGSSHSGSAPGRDSYSFYFDVSPTATAPSTPNSLVSNCITRLPAQTEDLVSPLSETAPAFCSLGCDAAPAAQHFSAAPPVTRFLSASFGTSPTCKSSAGSSLLDDRDFALSLGIVEKGRAEYTSAADNSVARPSLTPVTCAVAQDGAYLTDERSDDWFRFTAPDSVIFRYNKSFREANFSRRHTMAADGQQHEQGHNNQFTSTASAVSSGFTPLPPIRRASTLNLSRKKDPADDDSSASPSPSPIEKDPPPMSSGPASAAQQSSDGQWQQAPSAASASPRMLQPAPHNSSSPHLQQQNLDLPNPDGRGQSAMAQHFNGLALPQHGPAMQIHPHQMMMSRGGPVGQSAAPGQKMINGQGQTIISLPDGRQWTEQESRLENPLNPSNRNRSTTSLRAYSAYDKETEGEAPPHSQQSQQQQQQQHIKAPSPQPPQSRPQNTRNPVLSTVVRHPATYPYLTDEKNAFPAHRSQVPISQRTSPRGRKESVGLEAMTDDKSLTDTAVRHGSISVSSVADEELTEKHKRGLSSRLGLGHHRIPNPASAVEQRPPDGNLEKKRNIFTSVTGISHSQPKLKSNVGLPTPLTFDGPGRTVLQQAADSGPGKKRLSELKGMIKGVGHAKEGVKDDRPVKIETIYESRPPMQDSPPYLTSIPALQGAQEHSSTYKPQTTPGSLSSGIRPGAPGPQTSVEVHQSHIMTQPAVKAVAPFMDAGRVSAGGPQPSLAQQMKQVKSEENGKKSSAGGFLGGLFNKQANKTKEIKSQAHHQMPPANQRPARTVRPPTPTGYHSFRPAQMSLPGQQLGPHPMLAGQPRTQRESPRQSPSPPALQIAQAVTMHRAAEITVSPHSPPVSTLSQSQQRPGKLRSQQSQGTYNQYGNVGSSGPRPVRASHQDDDSTSTSRTSLQLSEKSLGNLSTFSRMSQNRKPLGSENTKSDGPYMTSALSPALVHLDRSGASPSPTPGEQAFSQLSQDSQLGLPAGARHMRQRSLPSLIPSPTPSHSHDYSDTQPSGDDLTHDSVDLRDSMDSLGDFSSGQPTPGPMSALGSGDAQNGLARGPNGPLGLSSAIARDQSPRVPNSPAPSTDPGNLSKFFGAYDGGKPAAQSQATKEKSVASKFLGAFRRSSKQNEASRSEYRSQISPRTLLQSAPPNAPTPTGQKGNTNVAVGPRRESETQSQAQVQGLAEVSKQVPAQQMRAKKGHPNQPSPQTMSPPAPAARGQVVGHIPPSMLLDERGQMPSLNKAGAAALPSQTQGPASPSKQPGEPQYDQVPIPRSYEAVYSYGPRSTWAPSPYHAGRPHFQAVQYTQHQVPLQAGYPQQQWEPRGIPFQQPDPLPGAAAPPQALPNNMPYQPLSSHPLVQAQPPNSSPVAHSYHSLSHNQPSSQYLPPGQNQTPTQAPSTSQPPPSQSCMNGQDPMQAPTNTVWTTTPPRTQLPASMQPPALQLNVEPVPGSDNFASHRQSPAPSHHIAAAAPSQANSASPVSQTSNPGQFQSPRTSTPTSTRSPDAARLTSRMSVSRHGNRDVSTPLTAPTPPQFMEPDFGLDVERANDPIKKASEDIHDATPRLDHETDDDSDVKHASPDMHAINGNDRQASVASSVTIATSSSDEVTHDTNLLPESQESERPVESNSVRGVEEEKEVAFSASEQEEKILVDMPVELAAVRDDDDGAPMMSATSYPGQEWNPYGAGEFGDWE
ncbi:hypothetical protein GGS21DRAFT_545817 [Xylaria nigripes]|nr:hypothetical protein GGS21DRAFT_545817 [Xylaria nigripes]